MAIKYTKQFILPYCENSDSVEKVLSKIGLKSRSNRRLYVLITEILKEKGIYKGQGHNKGKSIPMKSNDVYFSNDPNNTRTTYAVRNSLFSRKIKEKICECCGNTKWNDKDIPLEVHHKDGNKKNNEISNLEILCPNCHYFTDTYKTKNIKNRDKGQGNSQ